MAVANKKRIKVDVERPQFIIKVETSWMYGPRARFWSIQRWALSAANPNGGTWIDVGRGGLAYTNWGLWRAVNKQLKKMQMGNTTTHYTLDKKIIEGIK